MSERCCPDVQPNGDSCGSPPATGDAELPGYRVWPFVAGWLETAAGRVPAVDRRLKPADILGRWLMRWGFGRDRYQVAPGLYALGAPDSGSPVLVTANYKLTFDLVRRETVGLDAWLLVLDTGGINVWCAAGKGTFGTEELVRRIASSGLEKVVRHRRLILPQLGAVGVAAHRVKQASGFEVVYGPVRVGDLRAFVAAGLQATTAMRRVTFTTFERLILTPVEITGFGRRILWVALLLLLIGGIGPNLFSPLAALSRGGAAVATGAAALLAGAVFTPVLLPWLPGRAFAAKGLTLGLVTAATGLALFGDDLGFVDALALFFALPALASFVAMNFTGSSTFTSPSGVEKEMRRAIPLQAVALGVAAILWVAGAFR